MKARIWLAPNDSQLGRVWCWSVPAEWDRKHGWRGPNFGWTRKWHTAVVQCNARVRELQKRNR